MGNSQQHVVRSDSTFRPVGGTTGVVHHGGIGDYPTPRSYIAGNLHVHGSYGVGQREVPACVCCPRCRGDPGSAGEYGGRGSTGGFDSPGSRGCVGQEGCAGHGRGEVGGAGGGASLRAALAQYADVFRRLATALHGVQEAVEEGERGLRTIDFALFAYVDQRVEQAVSAAAERVEARLLERLGVTRVDQMSARMEASAQPATVHQQTSKSPSTRGLVGKRHLDAPTSPTSSKQPALVPVLSWSPPSVCSTLRSTPSTNFTSTSSSTNTTPSTPSTIILFPSSRLNPLSMSPRSFSSDDDGGSATLNKTTESSPARLPDTSISNENTRSSSVGDTEQPKFSHSDTIPSECLLSTISYHPGEVHLTEPTASGSAVTRSSEEDAISAATKIRKARQKMKSTSDSRSTASSRSSSPIDQSPLVDKPHY